MRIFAAAALAFSLAAWPALAASAAQQAQELEWKGDSQAARASLEQALKSDPKNIETLSAYAEFLSEHRDPAAREVYGNLLGLLKESNDAARRAAAARRLVLLDLLAGDEAAAAKHLEEYRAAGGKDLSQDVSQQRTAAAESHPLVDIPGPLSSFARMAALSPDLRPEDVLPALARNVVTNGYQASTSNESLEQTEYLKLVVRYLSQARELEKLANSSHAIRIEACESTQTGDLLRVIGYRMRGGCGSEVVLETVNATRAFLTIDSGFPLAELEQALRTNRPFDYDFSPTRVPVLYGSEYWLSNKEKAGEFIDAFLSDPSICRLYLGMSKLDRETADALRQAISVQRIRAFAHVLDFFGGMFQIRDGKAVIPGSRSAAAWAELAGSPHDQGAAFFEKLIAKDDGWLASYFDALSRIHGPVLEYLTEPERMKRFYTALRGRVTSPGPARPVFRSNTDLMLLTTRLRLESDGRPHVPGGVEIWKNLFVHHPHGKYDGKLTKLATTWKEPDDVIEALFALCRKAVENEPLKIFMAVSDVNRHRNVPLEPATVDRLAREFRFFGAQYPIFSEVPGLSDKTILAYIETAEAINEIKNQTLRADSAGTMQALVSLWQIFSRQGAIPAQQTDAALSGLLAEFKKFSNDRELFDAGYAGTRLLLKATGTPEDASPQDRMIDLLAGTAKPVDVESHQAVSQEMIRLFEAQRLVSLKVLFDVAEHLEELASGGKLNTALINRLATRIAEIELPRASLSSAERNAFAFGYWTEKHVENQRKFNVRSTIEKAHPDAEKLREIRGQLASFLRDTLVGLNYVHYAPPGAQILRTNPLFVRGHDFLGVQGAHQTWRATEVFGTGWPSSAGGRLVGSLVSVPYALAEAEQNFLIPSREQALIWGDLVPQMIISAKVPRWWNVTPAQIHWVGLHMRHAESLLAESALSAERRKAVLDMLDRQASPARVARVAAYLQEGKVKAALESVTPAELFALASRMATPESGGNSSIVEGIRRMADADKEHLNYEAISRAFGTPKPTLSTSYQPELLNLRTFPTLMGYSSRIMAESWESNLLFYAALADELHLRPSQLNVLIPEWTAQTVENIFATHLEDWPALLRSLRRVGDEVRDQTKKEQAGMTRAASLR